MSYTTHCSNGSHMNRLTFCLSIIVGIVLMGGHRSWAEPGILSQSAPAWGVTEWAQLPEGKTQLDISDFKGKVLYLYCFQSWCPGCHSRGFPTLQKLVQTYGKDKAVAFVAIQTVFEGFSSNTFEQGKSMAKKYKLDIPFGHSGSPSQRSSLMANYRTGGTPWAIIVGPKGIVQYNGFHISASQASNLIERLKKQTK